MFKELMKVQWKWTRAAGLLGMLLGFAIPLMSVQALRVLPAARIRPGELVQQMQTFGILYALLAAGVGLAFALLAWAPDHKGRRYALSLPVSRSRYAAMRFGAGAIFLVAPAIGVVVGSLVAIAVAPIPEGMHAYPMALAIRFFLSSFVAFAIFFAVTSSTPRAAAGMLGVVAGVLLVAFVLNAMGADYDLLDGVATLLFSEPGLLSVFTGRWMLIDV